MTTATQRNHRITVCLAATMAVAMLAGTGCKTESTPDAAAAKSEASAEAPAAKGAAAAPAGPATVPTADPDLAVAAKNVGACTWSATDEEFVDCAALTSWAARVEKAEDADDSEALGLRRASTLVSLLFDADRNTRFAAATLMGEDSVYFESAPELAGPILDALEREKDPEIRARLVDHAGQLDLGTTRTGPRALALAKAAKDPAIPRALLGGLGQASDCAECRAYVTEAAKAHPDDQVRTEAIGALDPKADPAACKLLTAAVVENKRGIAGAAIGAIGKAGPTCAGELDAVVAAIAKQAQTDSVWHVSAIKYWLFEKAPLTDAHKKTLLDAARTIAKTSKQGAFKMTALEILAENDPASKAFIAQFTTDDFLGSHAKSLVTKMSAG